MTPRQLLQAGCTAEHDACIVWTFSLGGGYPKAKLNGRTVRAHMVACEARCGRRPSKRHVAAHNCGNHLCINRNHLRWATKRQNERDKKLHGTALLGERHPFAKLTIDQVCEIRRRYRKGKVSQASLALEFGVGATTISRIVNKRNWRHIKIVNGGTRT